nr:2622_t:CDS:2 [Entrophospora candida]
MKSLLSNLQKANKTCHSKASKLDLSLQEEILVNTDLPLSSQKHSSIVDLPLSLPEFSDDDEIIDLEAPEYDNENTNINIIEDNNIGETSKKKNHRVYYTVIFECPPC